MATALVIDAVTGIEQIIEIEDPAPIVPESITNKQARIVLSRRPYGEGKTMLDAAEEALAAMEGQAGVEARIQWERSPTFQYNHSLINIMCALLGIDEAAKAEMFMEGPTIE